MKQSQKGDNVAPPSAKRLKSANGSSTPLKSQQTLKGFFKSKAPEDATTRTAASGGFGTHVFPTAEVGRESSSAPTLPAQREPMKSLAKKETSYCSYDGSVVANISKCSYRAPSSEEHNIIDPIVNARSWSEIFAKRASPNCEGHNEPCITLVTKKPGINCGRSFWICPRPLGPSGNKETGTQWRCSTFIWCSDWNGPS